MYNKIIEKLQNKSLAILGFGLEGVSTYNFIRRHLPDKFITIIDCNTNLISKYEFLKDDNNVSLVLGDNYLDNLDIYDLIIKTPGVSLNEIDTKNFVSKLTSQMELFLEVFKDISIGITGTKGKSTTSSLIYQILKDQNKDVYLVGNIGNPVLDAVENYKKDSIVVMEISSHQLEYNKVSPHIGIVLNLYEDHLDHAKTLEHYHYIKLNMFRYQENNDIGIYNYDNEYLKKYISKEIFNSKLYKLSLFENADIYKNSDLIYFEEEAVYNTTDERKLLGEHNLLNITFGLSVAKILWLNMDEAVKTVNSFSGLDYRMQLACNIDSVDYYVDTLATIPEATIQSIEALKNVDTLIIGGMDRGIDYKVIIEYLNNSNVNNIICMPTTGNKIGESLINKNVYFIKQMKDVVLKAKEVTKKGKICLLSPAASSYEFYSSYKEKADDFIEKLKEK